MQINKFALLVEELELAGAEENQAYVLANSVDSAFINFASRAEITKIAEEILAETWEDDAA